MTGSGMAKHYYSVQEASDFLTAALGAKFSVRDVLELGARGKLRVCFRFEGTVNDVIVNDASGIFLSSSYLLRGYLQIPTSYISPSKRDVSVKYASVVEAVVIDGRERIPKVDWDGTV